ncbi:hypothetical protein CPB83DRAFT_624424 [Crepidotus variabilis]|uniref:Uncharacterized protein n=1 Tax=Crepidotus variabilis TaxID=179855 RepID=A0A9P6ENZ1_9AGAR|nr:hypothetical protein CPB83DRAFT_624424 [Crepidotus variabilis]
MDRDSEYSGSSDYLPLSLAAKHTPVVLIGMSGNAFCLVAAYSRRVPHRKFYLCIAYTALLSTHPPAIPISSTFPEQFGF